MGVGEFTEERAWGKKKRGVGAGFLARKTVASLGCKRVEGLCGGARRNERGRGGEKGSTGLRHGSRHEVE